jgi:GNAT superfamily N-acetyltransferase
MMRAPQGYTKEKPLVINGKPYIGGQVIPSHELEKLSGEEKAKLEDQAGQGKQQTQQQPQQPSAPGIEASPNLPDIAKDVFGKDIAPETLAELIGAPEGEVNIVGQKGGIRGIVRILFSARSDKYDMSRSLDKEPDGKLVMNNVSFFISPEHQGKGLGMQIFAKQVQACLVAGVSRITCSAGKDTSARTPVADQMNGYYTWPLFGYDAPLDDFTLPPEFETAKTVQDLYDRPGGREWWYKNGDELKMHFDLKPGSRSLQVLNRYLEKKGQPGIRVPQS